MPLANQRKKTTRKNYVFVKTDAGSPATERNDCTVRALSIAVQTDYLTAYRFMAANGRKPNCGAHSCVYPRWKGNDYRIKAIPALKTRKGSYSLYCTLSQWIKSGELPKRCIVRVSGHVFAVIDNVVHDSFQVGSRRKVTTIYAVEKL